MSLLAQRLSAQGQALQPLTLPPRAGAEITTLVGSFNQLVAAVQSADRTKQQMLAGVSHDLRTPLARLRLRIETECDGQLADELTSDLRAVERIVSQFLAYVQGDSRPGLGEPDSLRALITQAVERYRSQGQFVYATMGTGDAELPDLAVQRLLNNLIDNALSHGLAPVIVELIWHGDSPPALASLTVWDCGRGLDAAGFEQAQQPFMRLGERDVGLGHCGLGLAIVAQIAQQLSATLQRRVDAKGRFGVALTWPAPVDAKA
jgi:two-component system osmolarity sensor histidine kinase EnvZ